MPLHDGPHTFQQLATTVLPGHMARLREAMQATRPMDLFSRDGAGVKTLLRELDLPSDFSGCYVLIEGTAPIYVGISRGVIGRLRQHVLERRTSMRASRSVSRWHGILIAPWSG